MNAQQQRLDWDDVRYFLAVAREGRLLRAARAVGVEHTTIARRLEVLENSLGGPLFYRTAKGHLLTPAGQRTLASAEAMEQAALALASKARDADGGVAGKVRVAIVESWATHWLMPLLPALRTRHPRLTLEVLTGGRQSDLHRGEAELAVRTPKPKGRELSAFRLAHASVGLYASRELLGHHRGLDVDDEPARWRGVPLAIYTPDFAFLQSARWFEKIVAVAELRLATNSTFSLIEAARAGIAVVPLPRFVARRHADLVSVGARPASQHELWLVSHPEFRRDPRVDAVARFLKEHARALADD